MSVCFHPMYIYIFIILFCIIVYSYFEQKRKLEKIYLTQIFTEEQKKILHQQLDQLSQQMMNKVDVNEKLPQPIITNTPTRLYPGGRLDLPRFQEYQLMGFLYNDANRFPLYGRPKYRGKSDKYEYYIIDESRNRLQIPFKSRNDNELYDNDSITIPELNTTLKVKLYEYDSVRYDPTVY